MRGKITYYNEKTGVGAITNKQKRNFEFRKAAWHEFNKLPLRGMFVNFRLDEHGKIVDCRESIFGSLKRDYKLIESDFWATEDDFELRNIADAKKEWLLTRNLEAIDAKKPISATKSIDECFDLFFYDDIVLVYKYEEMLEEGGKQKLDYLRLKRFIAKAKSQLLSADSTIHPEPFTEIEQELMALEQAYIKVAKRLKVELKDAFAELFLPHQIEYLRYKKKLQLNEEREFQIMNSAKKLNTYLVITKPASQNDKEKYEKTKIHLSAILKEKEHLEEENALLKKQIKLFEGKYLNEFIAVYNFEDEQKKLFEYLKDIADRLAYKMDSMIWERAAKSDSIRNSFYRHKGEGAFCTMTFLRYYLKALNVHTLSAGDELLSNYLKKYEKEMCYHILLLSESSDMLERIKMLLLEVDKNFLVHVFSRAVEALHWLKGASVDMMVVDSNIKTLTVTEFVQKCGELRRIKQVEFVILSLLNDRSELQILNDFGIKHFVKKPINNEEFKKKVAEIFGLE